MSVRGPFEFDFDSHRLIVCHACVALNIATTLLQNGGDVRQGTTLCKLVTLKKCKIPAHAGFWIASQKKGVFIAELLGKGSIKHVICMDFRHGLVLDAHETKPLKMKPGVLDVCCGDGRKFLNFRAIREVQRRSKGNKRRSA